MRSGKLAAVAPAAVVSAALVVLCWAIPANVAAAARARWLPPANPPSSLSIDEHVAPNCKGVRDYSPTCVDESVAMLNAGRRHEQLGPLVLPGNWNGLTTAEQIFVLTELERTARSLPPDSGLAADWNAAAREGADSGTDPDHSGRGAHGFESIWAGGQPNPIVAMVGLVYDDGLFPDGVSQTGDCSQTLHSGCWGHRMAILHDSAATKCGSRCAVGAAYSPNAYAPAGAGRWHQSYAEVFGIGGADNPDPLVFSWASEIQQLPACERTGDTCSWSARPLLTSKGFRNVSGAASGAPPAITPWFRVAFDWHSDSLGHVALSISVGVALEGIGAVASNGHEGVYLRVARKSAYSFTASGTLPPGRWAVTIVYRTPPSDGRLSPSSTITVRVPEPR